MDNTCIRMSVLLLLRGQYYNNTSLSTTLTIPPPFCKLLKPLLVRFIYGSQVRSVCSLENSYVFQLTFWGYWLLVIALGLSAVFTILVKFENKSKYVTQWLQRRLIHKFVQVHKVSRVTTCSDAGIINEYTCDQFYPGLTPYWMDLKPYSIVIVVRTDFNFFAKLKSLLNTQ